MPTAFGGGARRFAISRVVQSILQPPNDQGLSWHAHSECGLGFDELGYLSERAMTEQHQRRKRSGMWTNEIS